MSARIILVVTLWAHAVAAFLVLPFAGFRLVQELGLLDATGLGKRAQGGRTHGEILEVLERRSVDSGFRADPERGEPTPSRSRAGPVRSG